MSDWVRTTIGDLVTLQRGFDITRAAQSEGSVPVVSSGGISSFNDAAMSEGPGVVIGRKGTLGRVFYLDGPYWPHDTTLWVRDFKGNDPRFIFYLFKNLDVSAFDVGSANPTLNRNHVHPLPAYAPQDLTEQQTIADVLGALDDKVAANRVAVRTAREICRLLFLQEVGRGDIARRQVLSIAELVRAGALVIGDGYRTKRSELSESGYRIIRVADIGAGEVSLQGPDFVSEEYRDAIGVKAGKLGDILLTTKGTVGRLAVVRELNERIVYSPQLCFFRVNDNDLVDHWYLRYWFESAEFLEQASHRMNNSDMAPYINLADIRSLRIGLPPIESQRKLSRTLDALESEVGALQEESRTLAATRDLMLPQLMSGKLRIKDAEKQVEAVV